MLAFEVSVNGRHVCTAGVGESGVVTAMLTWVCRDMATLPPGVPLDPEELRFEVGGRTDATELRWLDETPAVEDVVEIRIVEVERVDDPATVVHEDPAEMRRRQRAWAERVLRGDLP